MDTHFLVPLIVTIFFTLPTYSHPIHERFYPKASPITQRKAVLDLIGRVLGADKVQHFNVTIDPSLYKNGKDTFKLEKSDGDPVLQIVASRGTAASLGLNHYLKYFCNCQVSWEEKQLSSFPNPLPAVNLTIAVKSLVYYQNVCTWSYSFVWWGWNKWEQHLDWMALNGITLSLAYNGQESLWRTVYSNLGLTQREIDEHFSGPAFLAWFRMGNLRGWGGPLPKSYEQLNLALNKKIVQRMREFGMTPIFPAFGGHVPRAFSRVFPEANLTKMDQWCDFEDQYCCPFLLSPEDPLFQRVGAMFLKEVIGNFGTDHFYGCDTFNEMSPASGDVDYIRSIGTSIFNAMKAVDIDSVWVMQGWLFHNSQWFWTKDRAKALLTSVPKNRMLVLDLHSEYYPQYQNYESYFGQPFIWCMLHNFGGALGLQGSVEAINQGIFKAEKMPNSTIVGIGVTPEGINQNYAIYDLMLEMSYHQNPVNLNEWFDQYSQRRYGQKNSHAFIAWQLLKSSVYNYTGIVSNHGKYILVRSPKFGLTDNTWYNPENVFQAWDALLAAAEESPSILKTNTFKYDLVDVTRQSIQLMIDILYKKCMFAYSGGNLKQFQSCAADFNSVMNDLENILASNEHFLVGSWIADAKSYATTPLEANLLERNARNQITLWGPDGQIKDYACKQWSGLVQDYYAPRWRIFLEALNSSLSMKTKFNSQKIRKLILDTIEEPFTYNTNIYPIDPRGDTLEISKEIHQRWRPKTFESQ